MNKAKVRRKKVKVGTPYFFLLTFNFCLNQGETL